MGWALNEDCREGTVKLKGSVGPKYVQKWQQASADIKALEQQREDAGRASFEGRRPLT